MTDIAPILLRIAEALERAVPKTPETSDFSAPAYVWSGEHDTLHEVTKVNRVELALLKGIDHVKTILLENTRRFAAGLPANNALLWGARGMGKSSLVKAVHAGLADKLKLIEIHREDIETLPKLLDCLQSRPERFILFCDDLSFDAADTSYKSLKAALDGGLEGRPENVLFYATSNRRHLLAREMIDQEQATALHPGEVVEEKVSLSDRFGLWLGFHQCSQQDYLEMVEGYAEYFGVAMDRDELARQALEWCATRGARSGRVAWQFIQDLRGRLDFSRL